MMELIDLFLALGWAKIQLAAGGEVEFVGVPRSTKVEVLPCEAVACRFGAQRFPRRRTGGLP
jgi:hypothetical protein